MKAKNYVALCAPTMLVLMVSNLQLNATSLNLTSESFANTRKHLGITATKPKFDNKLNKKSKSYRGYKLKKPIPPTVKVTTKKTKFDKIDNVLVSSLKNNPQHITDVEFRSSLILSIDKCENIELLSKLFELAIRFCNKKQNEWNGKYIKGRYREILPTLGQRIETLMANFSLEKIINEIDNHPAMIMPPLIGKQTLMSLVLEKIKKETLIAEISESSLRKLINACEKNCASAKSLDLSNKISHQCQFAQRCYLPLRELLIADPLNIAVKLIDLTLQKEKGGYVITDSQSLMIYHLLVTSNSDGQETNLATLGNKLSSKFSKEIFENFRDDFSHVNKSNTLRYLFFHALRSQLDINI
ncbi:MAG: hypothetical protein LBT90_04290 [Holosporaceae bacterium]|jgi:hypothetical protein|nr:hypothetical protein [Holosporaceae bacterium]